MRIHIRGIVAGITHIGMAFAVLMGVGTPGALAQSAIWNTSVTAGGSWGIPSNWQGGTIPSGSTNTAGFGLDFTPGASVTLDGDRIIGTIQSSGANPWSLDPGTGGTLTVANFAVTGGPLTMNTPLAGTDFAKDGNGTLILSNPNSSYTGTLNINAGTLSLVGAANYSTASTVLHLGSAATLDVTQLVSGFRYGDSPDTRLNVHDGDILNGTGTVKGGLKVKSGGIVYPGDNGVGTLAIDGKGLFETGSNWIVKLGTANPGAMNESNRLTFSAGLTLEDGMNIVIDGNGLTFIAGQTYDYLISTGASSYDIGDVNFLPINFDPAVLASSSDFSLISDGSNLTFEFVAVPEPTTWAFIVLGTIGTRAYTWRKRRSVIKAESEEVEAPEE